MLPLSMRLLLLCACVLSGAASAQGVGGGGRVTLPAAEVDRLVQVIEFTLPTVARSVTVARGAAGLELPVQVGPDGRATFIVPEQKAGETLTFDLAAAGRSKAPGVEARPQRGRLEFTVGGRPAVVYQMDKDALPRPDIKPEYKRAGYLHPIHTPAGTIVSDDYPAQHVHHHGIWTPWTRTSFQGRTPDFWNMGAKTGTVEFVALERSWSGPVHGGLVARHRFVDLSAQPEPVVALHETWVVRAFDVAAVGAAADLSVFELELTQTCATADPLILPKYHYGGFGFRGRGEWLGRDKAFFLSSEGSTDRVKANHERMRWVHLWGQLESGPAGLTVLGHPDNFRAPQPVRVHPNEPYVSFIPSQLGDWKIEPGRPYVARFRFVAFNGQPDRRRLEALWNGYGRTAEVRLESGP